METQVEPHKLLEIKSAEASKHDVEAGRKPFGPEWGHAYWGKWQTIAFALRRLGIEEGSSILDVGMGTGWTTVFLAESGYQATGIDIAPASVEVGQRRARRIGVDTEFIAADMDALKLDRTFDAALVFDALHHTTQQSTVVQRISEHLRAGGWILFGEPSWLHGISPAARRTTRELGWVERGVRVHDLKQDCAQAGLGRFVRFYEGSAPHTGTTRDFAWQAVRLFAARFSSAPQMSVWLAAQRL